MYLKNLFIYGFFPLAFIFAGEEHLSLFTLEDYVVNSSPLSLNESEMTQSWNVLKNDSLNDIKSNTVADTLSNQPGISQSYYGPNANRPIIRGLSGFRVSVLENGLSAFDVSASSADHAVSVDPLLVNQIEILRGSSAFIHGCNAVGGVINIYDNSIPVYISTSQLKSQFRSSFSSVNNGKYFGGIIFHKMDNFIFQINSTKNTTHDYDTPTFKVQHEDGDIEETDFVENSHSEVKTHGLGGTYHFDNGYIGLSYSLFDSTYGVPNHEASIIDVKKKKVTLKTFLNLDGKYFNNALVQMTHGDYVHTEGSGDHTASFIYDGYDSNFILRKNNDTNISAVSFNYKDYDFKITGDESYLSAQEHNNVEVNAPKESTNPNIENDAAKRIGIGLMQQLYLSETFSINGGIRYENLSRDYDAYSRGNISIPVDIDRDDSCINGSVGFSKKQSEDFKIVGNFHYSERIPETSELYSSGAHHSTEAFEIGNPNLKNEKSIGFEIGFHSKRGKLNQNLSMYYNDFENFIYQSDTGFETVPDHAGEESLKIREYKGSKAKIYGAEYEFDFTLSASENSRSFIKGFADSIIGKNKTENTYLPRINPYRIGLGFYVENSEFRFHINAIYNASQTNTAPNEETTDSYTLLNARWSLKQGDSEFYLKANNLTNKLGFVHTSLLKESAPLPGRNVEIGYNVKF